LCKEHRPQLIWIEWPRTFRPGAIEALRKLADSPVIISFQDDNPFGDRQTDRWQWKAYFRSIPEFDLHLIKRPEDARHLADFGATHTRLWEHGVYTPLYHPSPAEKRYPASFVGTCMDDRVQFFETLLMAGLPVHVFGTRWETRSTLPARFPHLFHGPVFGEAYADVLRTSDIALGLVSHSNMDEWTMRTYEVPACGTALLAERTPTHQRWFEENRDAIFFSGVEECVSRIQWALEHSDARIEIASNGAQKACQPDWRLDTRMAVLLKSLFPDWSHSTEVP